MSTPTDHRPLFLTSYASFLRKGFGRPLLLVGGVALLASLTEGMGLLLLVPLLTPEEWPFPHLPAGAALLLLLLAMGAQAFLGHRASVLQAALAEGVSHRLRERIHRALLLAPWPRVVRTRPAHHLHLLTEEVDRVGGATLVVLGMGQQLLLGLAALAVAGWLSPQATLIAVGGGGILALGLWRWTARARRLGAELSDAGVALMGSASEHLHALRVVRAQGMTPEELAWFTETSREVGRVHVEATRNQADVTLGFRLGFLALAGAVAALALGPGGLDGALALILLLVLARVAPRIWATASQLQSLLHMLPAFERITTAVGEWEEGVPTPPEPSENTLPGSVEPPAIELEGVTFRYPGEPRPVLLGASARFPAGEITALVGPTGAGKTTLVGVVLGLLHPYEGTLRIGGMTEGVWSEEARRRVAILPQDPLLLHGTVRTNLKWGTGDPAEGEMADALRQMGLGGWIEGLPHGLDSSVGPGGAQLSGGERQRVALARALLRRPTLLVLDEPTSAVDAETEQIIVETLRELRGRCTILLVTHRETLAAHADRVYRVEGGTLTPRR